MTSLDVEYSGVFGLDILRQMEAKVDLSSSDLIIGRKRYVLTGLDSQDRGVPQVTIMEPVTENEWGTSGLINPAGPTKNEKATGEQGAGKPATPEGRELNPDCHAKNNTSHNTLSVVLAQMVALPPKSRVVVMGRLAGSRPDQELPQTVVEPASTSSPRIYVARVVSDVFVRTQQSFNRLSDAHRSSLGEGRGEEKPNRDNQGVPEEEKEVRTVMTSGSCGDPDDYRNKGPGYCIVEMLNTSNSMV